MKATTRYSDKMMLRLPEGMRNTIKSLAATNGRSMNAEIIEALTIYLATEASLEARVSRIEERLGL